MKSLARTLTLVVVGAFCGSVHAADAVWKIDVKDEKTASSACTEANATLTCLQPESAKKVNQIEDAARVVVSCPTKELCDRVSLAIVAGETIVTSFGSGTAGADGKERTYALPKEQFKTQQALAVVVANKPIGRFLVAASTTTAADKPRLPAANDLVAVRMELCPAVIRLPGYPTGRPGRASKSVTAAILVDVFGNVLQRSAGFAFDENDNLDVYVIGRKSIIEKLEVKRTSSFRDATIVRVLGEGTAIPGIGERREAEEAPEESACRIGIFGLSDFAPGRGIVQLSLRDGDTSKPVGTFDFQVHPLYVGSFTLGWARTKTVDGGFQVVSDGTQSVIAPVDVSDKDNIYTLFYTPYIWGKRDPEKPWAWDASLIERINPSLGLVIDDVDDNVLAGISIDLPAGIVFTAGKHYRRIKVLSPESNLSIGSPFTGTADQLPTAKSWESESFVGLSIDLRVMAKFVTSAFSSGTGQ